MKDVLTTNDILEITKCSPGTVRYWIKVGKLKAKIERRGLKRIYTIEKADFLAFWEKYKSEMDKEKIQQ